MLKIVKCAWENSDVSSSVQDFHRLHFKSVTAAAASTPKEVRAYPQRGSGPVSQVHLERGLRLDLVTSMIFWWKCVHFMRCPLASFLENSLRWRHNERDGVSNHQAHDCLPIVYSGADQNKHQSFASLAFVRGIHRWPVNSPRKWPVTREMFPFDDVIMCSVDLMSNKWSNLRVRTWKKRKLWYSFNIDQTHINRNWQVGKLYGCSFDNICFVKSQPLCTMLSFLFSFFNVHLLTYKHEKLQLHWWKTFPCCIQRPKILGQMS